MSLSSDLISQFVKVTNDRTEQKQEGTVHGTIVEYDGAKYVRIDGSDLLTPIETTAEGSNNDRVIVQIQDHQATVTGNLTAPSTNSTSVGNSITAFDNVVTTKINAQAGRIDTLVADNVTINETLTAHSGKFDTLEAKDATIEGTLTAHKAVIDRLDSTYVKTENLTANYATIANLNATNARVHNLESDYISTEVFEAAEARIDTLETNQITTDTLNASYANIDFSNIGKAAIEQFYATSGIIKDLVVGDTSVTGELVGVTIKGDLIEGGTVVADKLVVLGEDGLYYKLNTNGVSTTSEQTEYNSLNGSIITAKSITAEKVNVNDLVAFGATIGGFHITENSLYSGVKASVNNTTKGIYLDNDGQISIGDSSNYLKYFKDTDGTYKLVVSAGSVLLKSSKTVETVVSELQQEASDAKTSAESAAASASAAQEVVDAYERGDLKGEDAVTLRIDSSRGTVFKNNSISTVLSVTIYKGSERIENAARMHELLGAGTYLQWYWQKLDESNYGTILATDSMLSDDGFKLTISADEVDTKVTFRCEIKD